MPYTCTPPLRGSSLCLAREGYNCFQGVNIPPTGWLHKPLAALMHSIARQKIYINSPIISGIVSMPQTSQNRCYRRSPRIVSSSGLGGLISGIVSERWKIGPGWTAAVGAHVCCPIILSCSVPIAFDRWRSTQ